MANVIQGDANGAGRRIAIVASRFNELVTARLVDGALDALARRGVADHDVAIAWVPGAFELPLACRWLAASGRFDAIVALGAVIRGATSHYEHVCNQAARGILDGGLATGVPVAFGVLTCEALEDALERAGGSAGNKGAEAATAALEMAALRAAIDGRRA